MALRRLKVERFETKKSRLGYFSFGVRVGNKSNGRDFFYLKVNPGEKRDIERWRNNFYDAYRTGNGNYVLLSIEGVTLFDHSWKRRRNISLARNSHEYQKLKRLAKNGNLKGLEKYLYSVIGRRKI